ncbi:macrophage mannose receptor 1 [Aplysia californica]|uniref:Macrophage mannose receptor 1 n=1 Tax=Aplysia californica TaxID=6500 RepID=A0ABM0JG15_APLCA|nr:macrophage mannose receptor 1 [Aplysia californica]
MFQDLLLPVLVLISLADAMTLNDCPSDLARDHSLQIYKNSCFQFVLDHHRDYPEANKDCKRHGGTLALTKTKDVQDFLVGQLEHTYHHGSVVWIGLTDMVKEDTYVWEDGTVLGPNDFKHWASGRLLHQFDDCAALDPSENGLWYDYPCESHLFGLISAEKSYVCEYKMQVASPTPPVEG